MAAAPPVSVLLPVLNEIEAIDACLGSLTAQDYPAVIEIIVADGGSSDGTRERLAEWAQREPRLRMIDNPQRIQSYGLNAAAEEARGEILVRVDGHSVYAPDYITASVRALTSSRAVAAGGHMTPRGHNAFTNAVAGAMMSRWAIGPGDFHHLSEAIDAESTYLGAFAREDFLAIGGYRHFPSRVAEDADLFYRWRRAGKKIRLDPAIRSWYQPRGSLRSLWRQYARWGAGKADMLWANGRWPSWRPAAPLLLVIALVVTAVMALFGGLWWPLAGLLGAWLTGGLASALAARVSPGRFLTVAGAMHLAYGLGLAAGLVRGPWRTRRAVGA